MPELICCRTVVRDYELMYIVRPDLDDDGLNQAVASVRSLVESRGGEVVKTTMWGKRRLAYEVQHIRDGFYVIDELRLDGGRVGEIEGALRIHDQVFRHLLVAREGQGEAEPPQPPAGEAPPVAAAPGPVLNEEELDAVPAAVDAED